MRTLGEVVRLVSEVVRARDPHELYETALSALSGIVGVERSSILLLDQANVARFVAWRGLSDNYRASVEGHFPWAVDEPHASPILIPDVEAEPSLRRFMSLFEREQIGAIAFIPVMYRDRLVGKFVLYYEQPHLFVEEEIELAKAVAYLVAIAIERSRLYATVEESDRRKDAFLATLAHELRNPLASGSAALAVMEEAVDAASASRARAVLARSVHQMAKLVDDLLDVSRITRGVIDLDMRPTEITSVIHQAIASIQPLISAQRQNLTLQLEELWVTADALRLEQIVANLLHNAAKYTPAGGHIALAARASDGGVEIVVEDDGIGIEPEVLPRLFELFMQVDKWLARARGGLGIGLTIVHELVRRHGGTVRAKSAGPGKGATFTVWLPGRGAPAKVAKFAPAEVAPSNRRRVLVVDDNHDAASMLATYLADRGHEVTTASDGATALALVAQLHPDVVLLDLGLPEISGYEVAERLRASEPRSLRIVAISGYARPEDVTRSRAAGCDEHLAKPVDLAALAKSLAA